jgi:hypothetical protein
MKIRVKIFTTLNLDPEEYAVPSDGSVTEEFEELLQEVIHDINGIEIKNIRVTQEEI